MKNRNRFLGRSCLAPQQKKFWKGQQELRLGPTATAVLQVLIEQAGRMFTQEELLQQVWAEIALLLGPTGPVISPQAAIP